MTYMGKNSYYVYTVKEDGKYFSSVAIINNSNNLIGIWQKNVVTVNACDSLRAAKEVAADWNAGWKRSGTNLY